MAVCEDFKKSSFQFQSDVENDGHILDIFWRNVSISQKTTTFNHGGVRVDWCLRPGLLPQLKNSKLMTFNMFVMVASGTGLANMFGQHLGLGLVASANHNMLLQQYVNLFQSTMDTSACDCDFSLQMDFSLAMHQNGAPQRHLPSSELPKCSGQVTPHRPKMHPAERFGESVSAAFRRKRAHAREISRDGPDHLCLACNGSFVLQC